MKYEITSETKTVDGGVVRRIRGVDGREGGFVESEANLSQAGACWLHGDSVAFEDAEVSGDAQVYGTVRGRARIRGSALVHGEVSGDAVVEDRAKVYGVVKGHHVVGGDTVVYGVLD